MRVPENLVFLQWLFPSVVFTSAVLYLIFGFLPNRREAQQLNLQHQRCVNAGALIEIIKTNIEVEQKRAIQLRSSLSDVSNMLVNDAQATALPTSLHRIALDSDLQILQLTPANSTALSCFAQHRFTLRLSGQLPAMLSFLYEVERQFPSIRVSQMETSFAQNSQVNTAQVTLEVFAAYSENSN